MVSLFGKRREHVLKTQFVTMVDENKSQFYRIAYSYVKNEQDALDIVQESVCKGYASLASLKDFNYMKTWFTRILINNAVTMYNKKKRILPMELVELGDDRSIEDRDHDVRMDVFRALETLSERERRIVTLRFFEDYKLDDIAEIVEEPLNTVKSVLYRSLGKLRKNLEEGSMND